MIFTIEPEKLACKNAVKRRQENEKNQPINTTLPQEIDRALRNTFVDLARTTRRSSLLYTLFVLFKATIV